MGLFTRTERHELEMMLDVPYEEKHTAIYWKFWEIVDGITGSRPMRKLHDIWYYIKCALWYKYNRVHVKSLPPTWQDRDDLMVHAMFQLLADFVERESDQIEWSSTPEHKAAREKMDELLHWWRDIYLKFDAANEYEHEFYAEANRKEAEMERQLTEKLKEIIDLRGYLWS